ncbi:hypothetical protein [Nonomuraea sp. NPDC049725]|uniref:hypothetical protein n=1 Tax=Nonomuraea sp. NPDC049725 TaxID=3154508 RepID=UPI003431C8C8
MRPRAGRASRQVEHRARPRGPGADQVGDLLAQRVAAVPGDPVRLAAPVGGDRHIREAAELLRRI